MFLIYDIVFIIFAIIYFPYVIFRRKWHRGFFVRMGFLSEDLKHKLSMKENVWFHAVSVGEVLVLTGLIERTRRDFPEKQIVLTTVTKTGYQIAKSKLSEEVIVIFAPLDFSPIVRKYVRCIKPVVYITAETEIWPNLFLALFAKDIPIALINGRISDQAYSKYRLARVFLRPILSKVACFCMQTQRDAEKILSLGAREDSVQVVGNMKFDNLSEKVDHSLEDFGLSPDEFVWIAGSTHPGEEEIVQDVFKELRQEFKKLRLVIVPRHIERSESITTIVTQQGFEPVLFSRNKSNPVQENAVVIVDEIGYLRSLYSLAKIVFVGKSLTAQGGQNIIEPAFFGRPILVGPNMQNFKAVMASLLEADAILQVEDAENLLQEMKRLLKDPARMNAIGARAKGVVLQSQGATEKTLKNLSPILA